MSSESIQFWTMIGTWVASIGTVSAVITSLWFAYNQNKVKLRITVGHRKIVSVGSHDTPDYCVIKVVNLSNKPAKIESIGWKAGYWKNKVSFIQLFKLPGFDDLPKVLTEGEDATFAVPFNAQGNDEDWIMRFPKSVTSTSKHNLRSLKLWVHISQGQTFTVKPEKGLIEKLASSQKS
ncbi:hypothetical protein GNP61_19265 [Aliivibrio fischeri]|uniref:hypothetical protein n=1 Tax=Aliivibrio fischeri TaxID=668 RepID=UPI0012DA6FF9|nr:hypothetical protein [Aliivibrio fischeri]MUK43690.1 hypothetical protein [Aliivibrio fischeri]